VLRVLKVAARPSFCGWRPAPAWKARRGGVASALVRKPQSGTAMNRIAPFTGTVIRTRLAMRTPCRARLCQRAGGIGAAGLRINLPGLTPYHRRTAPNTVTMMLDFSGFVNGYLRCMYGGGDIFSDNYRYLVGPYCVVRGACSETGRKRTQKKL
jgi:hypothetical protein